MLKCLKGFLAIFGVCSILTLSQVAADGDDTSNEPQWTVFQCQATDAVLFSVQMITGQTTCELTQLTNCVEELINARNLRSDCNRTQDMGRVMYVCVINRTFVGRVECVINGVVVSTMDFPQPMGSPGSSVSPPPSTPTPDVPSAPPTPYVPQDPPTPNVPSDLPTPDVPSDPGPPVDDIDDGQKAAIGVVVLIILGTVVVLGIFSKKIVKMVKKKLYGHQDNREDYVGRDGTTLPNGLPVRVELSRRSTDDGENSTQAGPPPPPLQSTAEKDEEDFRSGPPPPPLQSAAEKDEEDFRSEAHFREGVRQRRKRSGEELYAADRPHDQFQLLNGDPTPQTDEILRPFPILAEEDIFKNDLMQLAIDPES